MFMDKFWQGTYEYVLRTAKEAIRKKIVLLTVKLIFIHIDKQHWCTKAVPSVHIDYNAFLLLFKKLSSFSQSTVHVKTYICKNLKSCLFPKNIIFYFLPPVPFSKNYYFLFSTLSKDPMNNSAKYQHHEEKLIFCYHKIAFLHFSKVYKNRIWKKIVFKIVFLRFRT